MCPDDGTPTLSVDEQLEALEGVVLDGRWRLLSLLGRGGMGAVYRGEQLSIKRPVAIKVIKTPLVPDERLVARFMLEGRMLSAMRHPHIVRLIDFGQDERDGVLFLVMELVEGRSLEDILSRGGAFTLVQVLKLGEQLMSALAEAHGREIVHRDLKPHNVMLEVASGVGVHVTLLDFGIAHVDVSAQEQLTRTGALQGTPRYMAPEQVQGEPVTPRTDIYAAGILFYRLLTGHEPFKAENLFDMMVKQVQEPPPPLEQRWNLLDTPHPRLIRLVHRMLAKEPEERPASALDVLEELRALRLELEALKSGLRLASQPLPARSGDTRQLPPLPHQEAPPIASAPVDALGETLEQPVGTRPSAPSRLEAAPPQEVSVDTRPPPRASPAAREVALGALATIVLLGGLGLGWVLFASGSSNEAPAAREAPERSPTEEPARLTTSAERVEEVEEAHSASEPPPTAPSPEGARGPGDDEGVAQEESAAPEPDAAPNLEQAEHEAVSPRTPRRPAGKGTWWKRKKRLERAFDELNEDP